MHIIKCSIDKFVAITLNCKKNKVKEFCNYFPIKSKLIVVHCENL